MGISFLEDIATLTRGVEGHGHHTYNGSRILQSNAPAGVYVVPTDDGESNYATTAAQITAENGGVLKFLADRIANANGLEYAAGDYGLLVTGGNIVVVTEEAVSDQDPVYVRITAKGGNTQLGAFRTDSDGDAAESLVLTNASTANRNAAFEIDGESFIVATGASGNASTIAGLIATAIDASAAFAAAAVGADVTVTRVDGASPGAEGLTLPDGVTAAYAVDSDPATAVLLPGARYEGDHSTGLALVKLPL